MFADVEELKEFILWAKSQKIQQVQVGETVVVFSALALIDDTIGLDEPTMPRRTEERDTSRTIVDDMPPDDDEDLFWSANKG